MNRLDSFTLMPLSAGDIIDRAVRLYRRHFVALVRIVLAPTLIAYIGGIAFTVGGQNFSLVRGDERILLSLTLMIGGAVLYVIGKVGFFVVLGGTSHALVNHFLDGSPLRARDVFRAVRERLWSLLGATVLVVMLVIAFFMMIYVVAILAGMIYLLGTIWVARLPFWAQVIFHTIFGGLLAVSLLALVLLIYGRIVYVPQALMVEGKGVFNAVSRSFTLAGRNLRRIAAILLFWTYVASSLYFLLLIPLNWYAYFHGVDINPFGGEKPLWYNITQQTLTQVSEILLMPIALLSFTILYIDSRVRKEGFDIELLANRHLPAVDFAAVNFAPVSAAPPPVSPVPSLLGLNDDRPAMTSQANAAESAQFISPPGMARSESSLRACQVCGAAANPDDRFCRQCGAAYAEAAGVSEGGERWSE
jgi:hypothetical protein